LAAALTRPLPPGLSEPGPQALLFAPSGGSRPGTRHKGEPHWTVIHHELRRPRVTLLSLWEEYRTAKPGGYGYSRWCELYRSGARHLSPTQRVPRLFADRGLARGDGRFARLMRSRGGVRLFILDDWGLEPLGPEQRRDLLEIVEQRFGRGATLITSHIPIERWHDLIGDPTLADAILDRIVHNAHPIQLHGNSLRKKTPQEQG
jgi:hypothetical protein